MFSIVYNEESGGEFIIGDNLSKYQPTKFKEDQYNTRYFFSEYFFEYDKIFMNYSFNNKISYLNLSDTNNLSEKKAKININSGVIIGTETYKNYIHNNFFEPLIIINICKLNLMKYETNDEKLGNEFYVYECNYAQITGKNNKNNKNYFNDFPNLVFNSKGFGYNFELTKEDLFKQTFNKIYKYYF